MLNLLSFENAKRNNVGICACLNGTQTRSDKSTRKHEYQTDSATFLINWKPQYRTSKARQFLSALINFSRFWDGSFGTQKCTFGQWTERTWDEPDYPINTNFSEPLPQSGKPKPFTFIIKQRAILQIGNKFPTQQTKREQKLFAKTRQF